MNENNYAVLILFFARPDTLSQVFEQVRKAKPSKLFLYQDGPREGRNDLEGIQKCREIVENIDWDCEVHKWYQDKNVGCDPSEYLSQKWAFSYVDKCIILEDDDVPSLSFFPFCQELLDKYENDERISMIAGMNHEEISVDVPYDYFFTSNVSIWGWATWKRVIDGWDPQYSFMRNPYLVKILKSKIQGMKYRKDFYPMLKRHSESGIEYYESIHMSYMLLNSGLSIVPTKNLIRNIGYKGGTHSSSDFAMLPAYLKRLYSLKTFELEREIKHPPCVIENCEYRKRVEKMMKYNRTIFGRVMAKETGTMRKLMRRFIENEKTV